MTTNGFIPLSVPHLQGNELTYVTECIESGWVSTAGSFVGQFEKKVAEYLDVPHAVACMNGTAALHTALLLADIQPDDEVIVPTVTFIAPVNAVRYVGAWPVFMDCDEFLNMDPEKLGDFLRKECKMTDRGPVNARTGRRVQAILPVHVFGHPADLEPISALASQFRLKIIEDATESMGSLYSNFKSKRKHTGTIGEIGCLSFNGNKIITTGGGGMIVTNEEGLARRARHLTTQAKEDPLYAKHDEIGYNYRMTNLQAAVGVGQMEQLERFVQVKRRNFEKYREALKDLDGLKLIPEPSYARSNCWHYALVVSTRPGRTRDDLMNALKTDGIETRPLWRPVHRQKPYLGCEAYRIEKADRYAEEILNLPCSIGLTDGEIARVVNRIRKIYGR